jgi:proline racemase/trans-L-3-hydroxyproline dehydratase
MILGKTIYTIDSHTAGMPTRIIVGGIPYLPGDTMTEKAEYFADNFDYIRTALFQEPRGLLRGVGALVTTPSDTKAQLGVFFMDSKYQLIHMCGHGSIGVITAAIEFGMVDAVEPITTVVLDTPAGLVTGYAQVQNGSVESVSIHNVPSFLYKSAVINMPNLGSIPVDVAFGGEFYAIIDADDIRANVDKKNASRLSELAMAIKGAANSQIGVKHPEKPISTIEGVRICKKPTKHGRHIKNITVLEEGDKGIDRSPCGTGTSAHLATLYAKGQLKLNQECVHESIIGTTFKGKVVSQTEVGEFDAIIPEITGSAYTTGINTIILSPNDPLKNGFLIE